VYYLFNELEKKKEITIYSFAAARLQRAIWRKAKNQDRI
jgi:hypothetical protein